MGGLSWIHWLLIAGVALVLFGGKGKISDMMGDFGKGVNSFKKGLSESGKDDPKVINGEARPADPASADPVNKDKTAA
jgi:sec-independent protein translocase protein TatA